MQWILLVYNSVEDNRDPEDQCFLFSYPSTTIPFHISERILIYPWVRAQGKVISLGKEVYLLAQSLQMYILSSDAAVLLTHNPRILPFTNFCCLCGVSCAVTTGQRARHQRGRADNSYTLIMQGAEQPPTYSSCHSVISAVLMLSALCNSVRRTSSTKVPLDWSYRKTGPLLKALPHLLSKTQVTVTIQVKRQWWMVNVLQPS